MGSTRTHSTPPDSIGARDQALGTKGLPDRISPMWLQIARQQEDRLLSMTGIELT
jgi:hypothetical protein